MAFGTENEDTKRKEERNKYTIFALSYKYFKNIQWQTVAFKPPPNEEKKHTKFENTRNTHTEKKLSDYIVCTASFSNVRISGVSYTAGV